MKKKNSVFCLILVVCCVVINFNSAVFSELKTNAFLELKVLNDTNIYYEKTDPKSSMITSFIPGLNFLALNDRNKMGIDYNAEIMNYSLSPSTNNATSQTFNTLIDLNSPSGFSLKLRDSYRDTSDPPSNELTKRIKRTQNNISGDIGYQINRLFSAAILLNQVNHAYDLQEYKALFDRSETETGLEVFYGISPKTSVLLEYDSGKIAYEDEANPNDSTYSNIKVGLKGKITPKTTGILKVGSQDRKYDFLTSTDNVSTAILSLTSITEFSKMTSLKLSANRSIVESTFINNNNYFATGVTIELGQKIGSKLLGTINVRSESDEYSNVVTVGTLTAKRTDTNSSVGLGIQYNAMEWLSANIGLSTKSRTSNFEDYNYTDSVTGFGIKAIF